ncbi:MAG: DUF4405 domain-containing protein [Proteobacteria bacterium]|jgi:hypothetical protein|nr:DUF4405 domain-containing protein [Pseudomonadota bacterium]MBU1902003.1 DUF4405 domain-containing protein [Pseudomonadota bacterium]
MTSRKTSHLWLVNVVSFILFAVLITTGLINWLVLPKGYAARGSFLITLRHFFVEVHEWAALGFIITIVIHIFLHWSYIKTNLKKT